MLLFPMPTSGVQRLGFSPSVSASFSAWPASWSDSSITALKTWSSRRETWKGQSRWSLGNKPLVGMIGDLCTFIEQRVYIWRTTNWCLEVFQVFKLIAAGNLWTMTIVINDGAKPPNFRSQFLPGNIYLHPTKPRISSILFTRPSGLWAPSTSFDIFCIWSCYSTASITHTPSMCSPQAAAGESCAVTTSKTSESSEDSTCEKRRFKHFLFGRYWPEFKVRPDYTAIGCKRMQHVNFFWR